MVTLTRERAEGLILSNQKNKARLRGVTSSKVMESVNLVVMKAAEMIAPYKATEDKYLILKVLTEVFIEHGFTAQQALVLSLKAYNS